ncbi:MAG: sodium:calcium antiporter, partial [Paludibacteraceae bacterium]|nr:sodium:calcium antiporter [Paludibacteraceae bacterium]
EGASGIAIALGVSQSVVALTIVSIGTSAPELASSIMAARKGDTDMALGNVVGSVVFNVFFVLGVAAVINPLALGNISLVDIVTLLLSSVFLWAFCKTHSSLGRGEGLIMIIVQVIYYALLIWQA